MNGKLAVVVLTVASLFCVGGVRAQTSPSAVAPPTGSHDFDFEFGRWRVHHRVLHADGKWVEFEGTDVTRPVMDGSADIEEHTFLRANGKTYGLALRAYDAKSGTWAIWWLDSRVPHLPMDPPVVGRFHDGVGTFFSQSVVDGKVQYTRFIWSRITRNSARWEQALSNDGKTWQTNWIMELTRVA